MFRNQRVIGLSWLAVWRSGCVLGSLVAVALWAPPARAEPAVSGAEKVRESVRTFHSAGKPIKVHRFEPATAEKRPAVLLLHGADGPVANQALYHGAARRLAARGYQVLFVHYFDRTDSGEKEVQGIGEQFKRSLRGAATPEQQAVCRARFEEWRAAVHDAVVYARTLPGVDGERVGLVGFSLGAYLALSVAADQDRGITAVVEFFGGLPPETRERLKRLPPVLGFHGDQDRTVPVQEAKDLHDLLALKRLPGEVHIYKGVGHVFLTDGQIRWDAAVDAESRTATFLAKHLKAGPEPGK
jgi:carboxymethylenebutenolidase